MSEIDKVLQDTVLGGEGFMCDEKRIDPNEVYISTEKFIEDLKSKLKAKDLEIKRLRAALERIIDVSPQLFIKEHGQIVTSEHYEGCWLECSEIADKALRGEGGKADE